MLELGTKAETLQRIYGKLSHAKVLEQVSFTVKEWQEIHRECLDRVEEELLKKGGDNLLIVRSSALNEDTADGSKAGKYESVANVSGMAEVERAVQTVISSYDEYNEDNQILVQPMLPHVKLCGVAFTIDPSTLGNYYVINYDASGSTSSITSGIGGGRLLYVFKGDEARMEDAEDHIKALCLALSELEDLFCRNNLDVEFAFTELGELYIFQVRLLCLSNTPADYESQCQEIKRIEDRIRKEQMKKPFLCGKKTIYSVMTDWNPAEMIGVRPKPLAMSIYREIVTDSIWAYQRDNYGYRNLRSFPLMVDFGGLPYIDVRISFNSFIPAELDEKISEKLVDYYIEQLEKEPSKHDKAEFEIIFSCYTLDLPERITVLKSYGFTQDEIDRIVDALRNVTNQIIDYEQGLWKKDYEKLHKLEQRYEDILAGNLDDLGKVYWLVEDCKRYGTLPFAGLARAAFIAVQMLRSMVCCNIISEDDYQLFMNEVNTVSSGMKQDFLRLSRRSFLQKYGHLRPGTYDITSLRYDEAPELYFSHDGSLGSYGETEMQTFRLSMEQMHKLKEALDKNGLSDNILELMDFIKSAIEGREYGKFVFTKSVSRAMQLIENLGSSYGISRENCAYINLQALREMYVSTVDAGEGMRRSIQMGKEKYEMTKSLILPPVLLRPEDVWRFDYPDMEPNYITLGHAAGEVVEVKPGKGNEEINDKILLIQSADPGYDWIFSHGIKGFITMYGGANSHMAIRAGELGIPAAVGVGLPMFEKCRQADYIEIDAAKKCVRILREKMNKRGE